MKILVFLFVFSTLVLAQELNPIMSDAEKASTLAMMQQKKQVDTAIKSAIARLKVSAVTNQDIADILTLLQALNSKFNQ